MEYCRRQVTEDCQELLNRFQSTQSVRFEVFSQVWRDMKFQQIFSGLEFHERRPFCRLVLEIASHFFLPPFNFHIRVGGLYLMYALAHQQLAEPPEKVRLSLKDWKEVQQFEEDALNAQHFDVVLMLRRLLFEKLVHFTATPTLLSYKQKKEVNSLDVSKEFLERTSRPMELINPELLEELSNIHHVYEKLKSSIPDVSQKSESNMMHRDVISRLQGAVLQFSQWQQRDVEDEQRVVTAAEESSSGDLESAGRAQRLASIKTRAFQTAVQAPKSRRHRQVQLDANPTHSSGRSRSSRLSLKARTTMHVRLTGDLEKEASTSTRVNHLSSLDSASKVGQKTPSRFCW